jgi:hypothetical protein
MIYHPIKILCNYLGIFICYGVCVLFSSCSSSPAVCKSDADCKHGEFCRNQRCVAQADKEAIHQAEPAAEYAITDREELPSDVLGPDSGEYSSMPEPTSDTSPDHASPIPENPTENIGETHNGLRINIFIAGELTPIQFHDNLSGQTPKNYFVGIQKYEILRTRSDPSPVTVFDFGDKFQRVSMLERQFVGFGHVANMPNGTYDYGRTTIVFMEFDVNSTAHAYNMSIPGDLHVYYAIGNHTDSNGKEHKIGDVSGYFNAVGQKIPYNAHHPVNFSLSDPDTGVDTSTGKTLFLFKLERPIIKEAMTDHLDTTLHFNIFEAFRWQDIDKTNYKPNIFDISSVITENEPVLRYGANHYRVTTP